MLSILTSLKICSLVKSYWVQFYLMTCLVCVAERFIKHPFARAWLNHNKREIGEKLIFYQTTRKKVLEKHFGFPQYFLPFQGQTSLFDQKF